MSAIRETGPQISDARSRATCCYTAAVTSSDAPLHTPGSAVMLCAALLCCQYLLAATQQLEGNATADEDSKINFHCIVCLVSNRFALLCADVS